MLYTDAIRSDGADSSNDTGWLRPTTVLWLSDLVYARQDDASRIAWRAAALGGNARRAVEDLQESWGIARDARWYADNSRETLRDETFPAWRSFAAVVRRVDIPSTSSKPAWALLESFADLFDPALTDGPLEEAVTAWRDSHMTPGDRFRIATEVGRGEQEHQVVVNLPSGGTRSLEPGDASRILRGVIEGWAPARLSDPVVLTISEPGDKVYIQDAAQLKALGVTIDPQTLLPDAVIVDIGSQPVVFWIVEVAASDGVVDEARLEALRAWAADNRIPVDDCEYLTAFWSRNSAAARRRLKDLAVGTYAWFLAEPSRELSWREIAPHAELSRVVSLGSREGRTRDSMRVDTVWCEVRLGEVAEVVGAYQLWKDEPWYHEVDWKTVCDAFSRVVQSTVASGAAKDLVSTLDEAASHLSERDQEGLASLWSAPITVTLVQLTNGGHRMSAMLEQGVESVPGLFHRADIGESVDPDRVYPKS